MTLSIRYDRIYLICHNCLHVTENNLERKLYTYIYIYMSYQIWENKLTYAVKIVILLRILFHSSSLACISLCMNSVHGRGLVTRSCHSSQQKGVVSESTLWDPHSNSTYYTSTPANVIVLQGGGNRYHSR